MGAIVALIGIQMITRLGQDVVQKNADAWLAAYAGPAAGAALAVVLLALAARPGLFQRKKAAPVEEVNV